MAGPDDEMAQLRLRVEGLEREVRALRDAPPGAVVASPVAEDHTRSGETAPRDGTSTAWFVPDATQLKPLRPREAKRLLVQDAVRALSSAARALQERLHFVAFADGHTAFKDGALRARSLVAERHLPALVVLGAACGNPIRARLLQHLYLRDPPAGPPAHLPLPTGGVDGDAGQMFEDVDDEDRVGHEERDHDMRRP